MDLASLTAAAVALSAFMACAWWIQRITGNAGWIDTIWTFSLGAVAVILTLTQERVSHRQIMAAAFAGIWSVRLGLHLFTRTLHITDDPRYRDLMEQWGPRAGSRLFWFLQSQAAVSILLAGSIVVAAQNPAPFLRPLDLLAALVFSVGLIGGGLADLQLRRFKSRPENRGRICDRGLWRWSRHPNYFFEWMCWLSYPLLAMDGTGAYPLGYVAFLAPVCMYWLLAHVSGIPPLETHLMRTRGGLFAVYRARTSAFFPWPPRR